MKIIVKKFGGIGVKVISLQPQKRERGDDERGSLALVLDVLEGDRRTPGGCRRRSRLEVENKKNKKNFEKNLEVRDKTPYLCTRSRRGSRG